MEYETKSEDGKISIITDTLTTLVTGLNDDNEIFTDVITHILVNWATPLENHLKQCERYDVQTTHG